MDWLATTIVQEVDRVRGVTAGLFTKRYKNQIPVVVQDVGIEWNIFKLWTADYLKVALGHEQEYLQVFTSKNNLTFIDNDEVTEKVSVRVKSFVDYVLNHNQNELCENEAKLDGSVDHERTKYYLRTYSMPKLLYDDISSSTIIQDLMNAIHEEGKADTCSLESFKRKVFNQETMQLWLGTRGNVTPLHYDRNHGLLLQVRGRKEVVLFSHEDTRNLYPHPSFSERSHISRINLRNLQQDVFPKLTNAQAFHCILNEGELLYIPPFWWHDVTSLNDCISVTFPWDIESDAEIPACMLR